MRKLFSFHRWRLRGVGLLEIGLGLGILGIFLAGSLREVNSQAQDARAKNAADHLAQASAASKEYMRVYRTGLLAATAPGGGPVVVRVGRSNATSAIPGGPSTASTLPSVQGGGFLHASYVDRNSYGGTHFLYVRQPVAGSLEGIVEARFGTGVTDRALGRIMSRLGAPGGAILSNPTAGSVGKIQGTGGAWEISNADRLALWNYGGSDTGGVAVSFIANSSPVYNIGMSSQSPLEDYLYRNNIGIPEANTMRTALNMGNENINNAATVNANRAVLQNGGMACAGNATGCNFRISDDGAFFDNNDGWVRFVGAYGGGGLTVEGAGNNLLVGGTVRSNGRMASMGYDPNDLPAGWGGGIRTADVVANGTLAAGYNSATGGVAAYLSWDGDLSASRDGYFGRDVRAVGKIATNGYNPNDLPAGWGGGVRTWDIAASGTIAMWNPSSNIQVAGMNISGYNWGHLVTTRWATLGDSCEWGGAMAIDGATGNPLWCWGTWKALGDGKMGKILWVSGWDAGCEPGYYRQGFHANVGNTNNSIIHQCVKEGY